ncbi:MAG: heparinase II/III family protein [Planctomycetes bacterium]|nr:heparinase II/III family protein [Planctomycetota bacterium]
MASEPERSVGKTSRLLAVAALLFVFFATGCAPTAGSGVNTADAQPAPAVKAVMFPDLITPKSYPDALQRPDYDPLGLIPRELPARPRVFTTTARLRRAAARVAAGSPIDVACLSNLISRCRLTDPLPDPASATQSGVTALRNAVAYALTGRPAHRERALALMRLIAEGVPKVAWTGFESETITMLAGTYDLLAAEPLDPADDRLFREMLGAFPAIIDRMPHRRCNNHNAYAISARLAVGLALDDRQTIHDALYGCGRGGNWRYGLVHLLRHDFLADGMQWEGSMSYHMLVLCALSETLTMLENVGVDLWRRELPSLMQNDGTDEHRDWGPKGTRCIRAAYDAFFYQAFSNGDYSLLHDQIMGNFLGAGAWGPILNKAYEVYGDPRYAWLLNRIDQTFGRTRSSDGAMVPVWFIGGQGDLEWVRLESRDIPAGHFSFADDAKISLTGKHVNGCSLFPAYGSAVLRADPRREDSPAVSLYFGTHNAGHRSPAALHMEVHAGGKRVTDAPHHSGLAYDDPNYLKWVRSTIAHNTVTVDERPMFPYDFETDSIWETDLWRDSISDGELVSFQPEASFKAVRASNDNVYPGVKLDRTVVLTGSMLIDVFRVTSQAPHSYDWAVHCHGEIPKPAGAEAAVLGRQRGYRHLSQAWQHPTRKGWVDLPLRAGELPVNLRVLLPGGASSLVVASDPPVDGNVPIGEFVHAEPRTAILVRSRAASALFVSVWSFGAKVEATLAAGAADGDVVVVTSENGRATRWSLPLAGPVQATGQSK